MKNQKVGNELYPYHRYPAKYLEDFKTDTDYFEYLRKHEPETLKGERVKSFEELLLADWLYLNEFIMNMNFHMNIKQVQCKETNIDRFYLGDSKYLEHFGIDKEGKTAPQINSHEYNQSIVWKRNIHRQKEQL